MERLDQPFDLSGKVALVTGASRGLGKAMSVALAQAGCDVAVNARNPEALSGVIQEIQKLGRKAHPVIADITDEAQVEAMVQSVRTALGRLDVVINNAGVFEGTYFFRLKKSD